MNIDFYQSQFMKYRDELVDIDRQRKSLARQMKHAKGKSRQMIKVKLLGLRERRAELIRNAPKIVLWRAPEPKQHDIMYGADLPTGKRPTV